MELSTTGPELPRGTLLKERYEIAEKIGNPVKNTTYRALDRACGDARVVVKVMSFAHLDSWKEYDLFQREAQTMKNLDHPCIPHYVDFFTEERGATTLYCLVQECIDGEDLEDKIKAGWRVTEKQAIAIAKKILKILLYLQSFKPPVIHRDLNPRNLLMDAKGGVFLVDFGAVQAALMQGHLHTQTVMGTVGYMPMEQLMGRSTEATDLYALGVTIVYLLTHTDPVNLPLDGLRLDYREAVTVSRGLARWIDKCIEPDPADRFRDADEALAELRLVELPRIKKNAQGDVVEVVGDADHLLSKEELKANPDIRRFIREVKKEFPDLADPRYR